MWKYNPNYMIKFNKYTNVILPPLKLKHLRNSEEISLENQELSDSIKQNYDEDHNPVLITHHGNHGVHLNNEVNTKKKFTNNLMNKALILKGNDGGIRSTSNLVKSTTILVTQEEKETKREKIPFSKKNKAPCFELYTGRKDQEIPITNNVDFYIPEVKDNKKNVDFSKMLERKGETNKLKSPGICYYEPNYQYLETNMSIPIFKVQPDKNDPRYKIQKIWRSYNTPTEYKSVAFNN